MAGLKAPDIKRPKELEQENSLLNSLERLAYKDVIPPKP
jgi:hypothetical protein